MDLLDALIMGVVEGLTEFLPVSSTGHLILTGHLLGIEGHAAHTFEIFIQLGAILAVAWVYRTRLLELLARARTDAQARDFILKVGLAFLPAAVVGLLAGSAIKRLLFSPQTVAVALIVGGVAMIALERFLPSRAPQETTALSFRQALTVGLCQILALIPGMSRSATTIMGGMVSGLDRRSATEFSFFLALPTLGAATVYDLLKNLHQLSSADVLPFSVGVITAFVSALVVIRAFLKYVQGHDFQGMALYRIVVGVLVLWWM
ncbi:MAG: undecaprenyl-diphosphate phosphatase [Myxococcota bacterium]